MNWSALKVSDLKYGVIEEQTRTVDWREEGFSDIDDKGTWEIVYPERGECGYSDHTTCERCDGSGYVTAEEAQESDPDWCMPMMNYAYSLPEGRTYNADSAALVVENTCLTLVQDVKQERYYLALTGGGMDLSWSIVEAFVLLGLLPPAHFRLPEFAGETLTPKKRKLIAAMRRSYRGIISQQRANLNALDRTVQYLKNNAKRKAA